MATVGWNEIKTFVKLHNVKIRWSDTGDQYLLYACDGPFFVEGVISKSIETENVLDFENNFKTSQTSSPPSDVVTQMEKNDKTLRSFCVFQTTDANGTAEICIPVPSNGRWIAYGDAEFETRDFGDYVKIIEVTDLDRVIAWQVALAQDPNATSPVDDATVIALGNQVPGGPFPLYPVVGHYDERSFANPMPANAKGDIRSGMSMDFKYGITEAQPVGGYGFLPGLFYLRLVAQKASSNSIAGIKCQFSIDWAEQNP